MLKLNYLEAQEKMPMEFSTNYLVDRSQPGFKDISAVLCNRWYDSQAIKDPVKRLNAMKKVNNPPVNDLGL